MEHIAALLLIVGCSGELKDCREIAPQVSVFETMEECGTQVTAARKAALRSAPRVYSQCLYVDPAMDEEDAQLVWEVRNGELVAAVVSSGGAVASANGADDTRVR